MRLPKVQVKLTKQYYTCECCGGYNVTQGYIYLNGEEKEYVSHETHFGEGNWSGDNESLFPLIFNLLGYSISYRASYLNNEKLQRHLSISQYISAKNNNTATEKEIILNLIYDPDFTVNIIDVLIEMDDQLFALDDIGCDGIEFIFSEVASKLCNFSITIKEEGYSVFKSKNSSASLII